MASHFEELVFKQPGFKLSNVAFLGQTAHIVYQPLKVSPIPGQSNRNSGRKQC